MNYFHLEEIERKEIFPGITSKIFNTETMTLSYVSAEAEASFSEHAHEQEQVIMVLEGHLEITVDGETTLMGPGDVVVIGPNVKHSGKFKGPSKTLDVYHPQRY